MGNRLDDNDLMTYEKLQEIIDKQLSHIEELESDNVTEESSEKEVHSTEDLHIGNKKRSFFQKLRSFFRTWMKRS